VTGRDPDEPDRTPKDHETDVDAAFAEIVAGWERDHGHTPWPGTTDPDGDSDGDLDTAVDAEIDADETPEPAAVEEDPAEDEGHFVPPEPPPFPRPQPQTIGAIALFGLGLMMLLTPDTLGFSAQTGLILGLLAFSGSIVWLIARLRQGPPTDSGWDDGAQL
jgi:hypothetical protein